jgi:hypothetical protein
VSFDFSSFIYLVGCRKYSILSVQMLLMMFLVEIMSQLNGITIIGNNAITGSSILLSPAWHKRKLILRPLFVIEYEGRLSSKICRPAMNDLS